MISFISGVEEKANRENSVWEKNMNPMFLTKSLI